MSDDKGLYQKYSVSRNDGKEISQGCFVLELKDPIARKAILAYAEELGVQGKEPKLAYDLKAWVNKHEPVVAAPVKLPEENPENLSFERVVLIKKGKPVISENLYIVDPEDVEEYRQADDLELNATISVKMDKYYEYMKTLEDKEETVSIVCHTVDKLIKEWKETDNIQPDMFWKAKEEMVKMFLEPKLEEVKEKFLKACKLNS
jgi:hypothetical protein